MSTAIASAIVALAGLVVTLAVLVWKFGAVFGETKSALRELREDVEEIRRLKDALADFATLKREVGETREAVRKLVSDWPRFEKRLSYVEWEMQLEKTMPGHEPRPPVPPARAPRPTTHEVREMRRRFGSRPDPREDGE